MVATEGSLLLIVYGPAFLDDDKRPLAVAHAMERALPGLRLGWTISDEGGFIPLPRRDAGLARNMDGGLPLLCNGDESHLVTLTGWESPAGLSPGGRAQLEIHAKWLPDAAGIAAGMDVLEGVAEGVRAFWGHVTPDGAALDIALQTSPTLDGPPCPPRGLPSLKLPEDIRSPEIPHRLGWLNYWSAAAARAIGFPDPTRDAELLSRSRRTATGGWVVRLTDAPLDLDNPAHLDALLRAYERFPEIGGRR
ncbi:hypothetical protein F0U61_45795 [Archangium violaceum]|uniref:DUF5953 family protein n=1 Tax=Archangium violaceum TaxID=83451 RepID=UPI002B2E3D66|nr:hypothetical protein F0U61_45795 [Archangium violaceum]